MSFKYEAKIKILSKAHEEVYLIFFKDFLVVNEILWFMRYIVILRDRRGVPTGSN